MSKQSLLAASLLFAFSVGAQIQFVEQNTLLPTQTFHSGNSIGVCDMNNDKKDDIVRAQYNAQQYVEFQAAPNDTFTELACTGYIGSPWGMCVGDYNNNDTNDVIWGDGNGPTYLLYWSGANYLTTNLTGQVGYFPDFPQGVNMHDIDNDGFLDVITCNDNSLSHIFHGNGATYGWTAGSSMMPLATVPASDNSGNYASIWTDINADGYIDMMITHCRQGVTSFSDPRRIDQIFINNGNGTYTQDVTNWTGLRDGAQGWSTASGDIDNDGDMDLFVMNYDVNAHLWINNGNGTFVDTMSTSGIGSTTNMFGMNCSFHDFDNDGYQDLILSGSPHKLYRNNGNYTFTLVANPFPAPNGWTVTAHAVGDLNSDGLLDVYASYCNIYQSPSGIDDRLWMNSTITSNHYVVFDLVGAGAPLSNRNGIGAIVKIYGAWGVQTREVRSGEGYGIQNTFAVHFGLGSATTIDSVVVMWPSGIVDHPTGFSIDAHLTVNEGSFPTSTSTAFYHPFRMILGPNPMNDQVTINVFNYDSYGLANLAVRIYDVTGKAVYIKEGLESSSFVIDRTAFSTGMYVVTVSNGKTEIESQKLMVQ